MLQPPRSLTQKANPHEARKLSASIVASFVNLRALRGSSFWSAQSPPAILHWL